MGKNYDEDVAGIVGVVRQVSSERLLLQSAYYRDKNKKKIPLAGQLFTVNLEENAADFFVGDNIRVEKTVIVNLTKKTLTCTFESLLSPEERELLNKKHYEFLFSGFLEGVNIIGNSAAFRFRVTNRINADGKKLREDSLVNFCASSETLPADNGLDKLFLSNLFCAPLRKALTIKYTRIFDSKSQKMLDYVSFIGLKSMQNARTFLKKNC